MVDYLIGTSGWNYDHWTEKFYPQKLSKNKWLLYYCKHFNTVEVNYSFYKWPSKETLKKWYRESPKNFKFTLKAPRTITHVKKLKNVERQIRDFYKLSEILKEKLASILFQLPPFMTFNDKNFKKLEDFFKLLDLKKENVIEFRHESWWNKKVYDLFRKYKIIFCIVSSIEMPRDFILTSNIAYLRFHGINRSSNYSMEDLKRYAKKIKKLKCKKVYAYFNNDSYAYAIHNSKKLRELLVDKNI